jgi:hypothetical protein
MGKGSRPRPYSVSQEQFAANYDAIFGKKNMTPKSTQMNEGGSACGCGRSPTGKCIGWHGLSEDAFQERLAEYNAQKSEKSE